MLFTDVAQYFPYGVLTWLSHKDKQPGSVKIRENKRQIRSIARTLIGAKRENMRNGD
jgi:hypothetical protein